MNRVAHEKLKEEKKLWNKKLDGRIKTVLNILKKKQLHNKGKAITEI